MYRQLVHLVQRQVHHLGKVTLDHQVVANQAAHHVAHGAEFAQGNQRAEVFVVVRPERLVGKAALDLLEQVRSLLVRRLRTRGHHTAAATCGVTAGAGRTVTQRKNIGVARGLQGVLHHQLVDAVGLQAAQVLQKVRRLDARGPHHQLGLHHPPIGQAHAGGHHFRDLGLGQHLHTQARDQGLTCRRQARRQGRQDAVGRLDQADLDVLVRINPVQSKSHHLTCGAVQLGGQLHARRTRADDGHM